MVRVLLVVLALVALSTSAPAVDRQKRGSGTLARAAVPARYARLAEIAKDATPPKPGESPARRNRLSSSTQQVEGPNLFRFRVR